MATPIRILLVEDLPDDAFFVERALTSSGIHAALTVVTDEAPFRAALSGLRPQLILTDHKLPRFSSWRVLEIARAVAPDVPVVIVSGTLREEEEADGLKRGAVAVVRKSDLKSLPGVVRVLLGAAGRCAGC